MDTPNDHIHPQTLSALRAQFNEIFDQACLAGKVENSATYVSDVIETNKNIRKIAWSVYKRRSTNTAQIANRSQSAERRTAMDARAVATIT